MGKKDNAVRKAAVSISNVRVCFRVGFKGKLCLEGYHKAIRSYNCVAESDYVRQTESFAGLRLHFFVARL